MQVDPRYQRGKIYKIVCNLTGDCYVGSTIDKLSGRLCKHRAKLKSYNAGKAHSCKSFSILERDDYQIELICEYPCNNKMELNREEGKYQLQIPCVNRNIAGRTKKEYYEANKDNIKTERALYYEANKDKIKTTKALYYEANKDNIKTKKALYYEANKDKIKTERALYYEANKDNIKTKKALYYEANKDNIKTERALYYEANKDKIKEKHNCACGGIYTNGGKTRHERTNKHQSYLQSL